MSDAGLRELEQAAAVGGPLEQKNLLNAQLRAGYVRDYVACGSCTDEVRVVLSHGSRTLCGECGGQGWTEVRMVPPK